MRTRTFIGLVLLIIILVVVSTPALFVPASKGFNALLVQAGLVKPEKHVTTVVIDPATGQPVSGASATPSQLTLNGYTVDPKTGMMRDTVPAYVRSAANAAAARRAGSRAAGGLDTSAAPVHATGTELVLDSAGCPVMLPWVDATYLAQYPALRSKYAGAATTSADATCRARWNAKLTPATPGTLDALGEGEFDRANVALDRGNRLSSIIAIKFQQRIDAMMTPQQVAKQRPLIQ